MTRLTLTLRLGGSIKRVRKALQQSKGRRVIAKKAKITPECIRYRREQRR